MPMKSCLTQRDARRTTAVAKRPLKGAGAAVALTSIPLWTSLTCSLGVGDGVVGDREAHRRGKM